MFCREESTIEEGTKIFANPYFLTEKIYKSAVRYSALESLGRDTNSKGKGERGWPEVNVRREIRHA